MYMARRYATGTYAVDENGAGTTVLNVPNETAEASFRYRIHSEPGPRITAIRKLKGLTVANFLSTIRPATGGDGPFFVVTETGGSVSNVTLGLANLGAAMDQAKSDQNAILGGATVVSVRVDTLTT
jgi:hypothetical protein